MQCSCLLGGCLGPRQPVAKQERSAKNTTEQKHQIARQPEPSLFLPVTRCLPPSITLVAPACFPCSLLPWPRPAGFLYLLGCRRQGGLLQGCGLLVWELPASVSPWRMQGPFGREKEYEILSSSLVSKAKQHVRGKYSTAECVLPCA